MRCCLGSRLAVLLTLAVSGLASADALADRKDLRQGEPAITARQIETHGACHLEAAMVEKQLEGLDLAAFDLLIIENVGNLICPVNYDLGEDRRVIVACTTEGEDKPVKYPNAYHSADACVINKTDLLEHVPFRLDAFQAHARQTNPDLLFFPLSCTTGQGMAQWSQWLKNI